MVRWIQAFESVAVGKEMWSVLADSNSWYCERTELAFVEMENRQMIRA